MDVGKPQEVASESHEMLEAKKQASEGSDILKAKKEALAATTLLRFKRVRGGSEIWMDYWREMKAKAAADEAAEAARPVKKRKRVIKNRVIKPIIRIMMARPFGSAGDLTPAQLAKRSEKFRQYYPLTTFVRAKMRDYEQTLIRQYNAQGYAEDETEVDYEQALIRQFNAQGYAEDETEETDSEEDATDSEN